MQAKPISTFRLDVTIALAMLVLHGTMMVLNQMLFGRPEFLQGNGWIVLSTCTLLLYTLLFCGAGATGLSVVGWTARYWYYNPADALRAQAWRMNTSGQPVITHTLWLLPERHGKQKASEMKPFAINASFPESGWSYRATDQQPESLLQLSSDRLWPTSAVQVSIAGCRAGKVVDCHDRQHPTYCVEKRSSNSAAVLS